MIILGTNSIKDTGYDVANSLRINSGDDCKLSRTSPNSSPTNADKFTISFWIKRSNIDAGSGHEHQQVFTTYDGSGSPYQEFQIYFTQNTLKIQTYNSSNQMELVTNRLFRDTSAWYSIIFSYDSSPSTPSSSSIRLWINGVQETSFSTETYPSQNVNGEFAIQNHIQMIGNNSANARDLGCYLAEFVGVDGQALINTDFGEFDEDSGIWKPIDVSGINVGTLGFYLDFENSSALGTDVSSVGNFTLANLAAIDQSTDTCTNNFATLNPLIYQSRNNTFAEGNLKITGGIADGWDNKYGVSTIAVSSGKWYVEAKATTMVTSHGVLGIISTSSSLGGSLRDFGVANIDSGGRISGGGGDHQTGLTSFSNGDIAGAAFDADNGTIQFYRNGSTYGNAVSSIASDTYYFATNSYEQGAVMEFNFGSPSFSISSGNSDGNGYGNFEYAVPSGYYSLNTKNLAEYG